jgi:hypothetical protein
VPRISSDNTTCARHQDNRMRVSLM